MINRIALSSVIDHLRQFPAVALLGPRQVGKTTLSKEIAGSRPSIHLDLERAADRDKLADAERFLAGHADELVIIDEVHRLPGLFQALRGLIDAGRQRGRKAGHFLLLGSASFALLRQSGESLAGRIGFVELAPIDIREVSPGDRDRLWLRGGFPESFISDSDALSLRWREAFIRSYLERDIPDLAPRMPTATVERLWTMLAHLQGSILNQANLSKSLAIDGKTVAKHIDLLADLLLVRRLLPYHANLGKRLVKSPKIYVRDSGVLHALLTIGTRDMLFGHPVAGPSWEGFVIENILQAAPAGTRSYFFRTIAGAEIDLLLELPGGKLWAIEVKSGLVPKVDKGFHIACEDLKPAGRFIVYAGDDRYPKPHDIEAIGLNELSGMLQSMH